MVTPEILEYIRGQYMAGVAKSDIINALVQSGWVLADAQEAMSQVEAKQTSVTPTASPVGASTVVGGTPVTTGVPVAATPSSTQMPTTKYTAEPSFTSVSAATFTPMQYQVPSTTPPSGHSLRWVGLTLFGVLLVLLVDVGASAYYGIISFPITAPFALPFSIPGMLVSSAPVEEPIPVATTHPATATTTSATTTPLVAATTTPATASTSPLQGPPVQDRATTVAKLQTILTTLQSKYTSQCTGKESSNECSILRTSMTLMKNTCFDTKLSAEQVTACGTNIINQAIDAGLSLAPAGAPASAPTGPVVGGSVQH